MTRILIGIAGMAAFLAVSPTYDDSIREWQTARNAKLRQPDSWLALVGLFWLKPGNNTLGSADSNTFVLPKGSASAHVGTVKLAGERVSYRAVDGSTRPLDYNEEKPSVIKTGSISFYVIKRGDKFAVRVKDAASPVLKNFEGLKYFPIRADLRFQAKLIPDAKKIPILNILGATEMQDSPGVVEFSYRGQAYHLRPIFEDKTLFFLYKDPTNKTQTYQAGRMLNTPLPDEHGRVDLDFNKSYNPPCTFTPYATCPLPPKENSLSFPVEAGELRYKEGRAELTASR